MTVLGIFGEKDASQTLVTAALNDLLEAHLEDTPDEEFRLYLGIPRSLAVYLAILDWAAKSSVPVEVFLPFNPKVLQQTYHAAAWHRSANYMTELVERCLIQGNAKIYALLGDDDEDNKEPPVDVRRALVRALDNGLEVRDLAEAGLTYVGVADNPIRQGSTTMAAEEVSLQQAGELADEGDEESAEALTNLAAEYNLDPDEYPTWAELVEAIDPLLIASEEQQQVEVEEAPPSGDALSEEDLEGKGVPELRQLAKQLGVEGWETNRSAKLISGILAAQSGGDHEVVVNDAIEAFDDVPMLGSSDGLTAATLARGLRAFADALEG